MKRFFIWLACVLAAMGLAGCAGGGAAGASALPAARVEEAPGGVNGSFGFAGFAYPEAYFRADLNGDGVYEEYANWSVGSGLISEAVGMYDPVTGRSGQLDGRMETDYQFVVYEEKLYQVEEPFGADGAAAVKEPAMEDGVWAFGDVEAGVGEKVLEARSA